MTRAGLAVVALICAAPAFGQSTQGGISVETLPQVPGIGAPGQVEGFDGGIGLTVDPNMGLEQTPLPEGQTGFIPDATANGGFVQVNPGGQEGVALVQRPNNAASTSVSAPAATAARAGTLRALDKTIGETMDLDFAIGETVAFGRIAIRLLECRYPVENPASDAFAHVQIADLAGEMLFDGWMIASSPALMALEHPRYDVWVLSCSTS